ncbi:MAG TPA: hypothetical protein PK156_04045 [Polyangium sp.]|nr:hypothetical protein [Polyangium sp.]
MKRACEVIEPRGFCAAETSLTTVRQDVALYKPAVLFIDHALYDFDPLGFDKLAQETTTRLAIVDDIRDADSLLQRLVNPANPSGLYTMANNDQIAALLEADTKKYDSKTVHNQLELMREMGDADTVKLDRKAVHARLPKESEQKDDLDTIRRDRKFIAEQLERMRAEERIEGTSPQPEHSGSDIDEHDAPGTVDAQDERFSE